MRLPLCVAAAAVLIALTTNLAIAVEVLDQQNDLTGSGSADTTATGAQELAQTFTVGVTGTLTRIEVQVNRIFGSGGAAILTLYNTSGGIPNEDLGNRTLAWNLIPTGGYTYQSFDFSALAHPVTAGDVLAFSLKEGNSGATYGLRSSFNVSTYAGGE